jgi:hypothetical protein
MSSKASKSSTPQSTGVKNTAQNQLPRKRWYPTLSENSDQHLQNAMRFTWDSLYQIRESITNVANAAGVANAVAEDPPPTVASQAAGVQSAGASSSGSTGGGAASSSGSSSTGPSNTQMLGLNVKATPPANGQSPTYNSSTGQIEFMNSVTWTTSIPSHSSDAGVQGTIAFDPTAADKNLYLCILTGPGHSGAGTPIQWLKYSGGTF